jgi:ABC-type glycerol-3-phosphate transport system permease component
MRNECRITTVLRGAAAPAIFAFLTGWSRTFPPALFEFTGQFVSDWRGMTATAVLVLIPAVVFAAIIQRQLMEGHVWSDERVVSPPITRK